MPAEDTVNQLLSLIDLIRDPEKYEERLKELRSELADLRREREDLEEIKHKGWRGLLNERLLGELERAHAR